MRVLIEIGPLPDLGQNEVISLAEMKPIGLKRSLAGMDQKPNSAKKQVVIVVEDESDIRLMVAEALADAGFDVFEAEHADEAVAILQDRAVDVHALFTDVNMPGSMDGIALAHHSCRNWPWIVLLISSGRPRPSTMAMPPASRFLAKPYHPDHVVMHLQEMLVA